MKKVVLALTGGSGAQYGLRTLEVLTDLGHEVHLIVSDGAKRVLDLEVGEYQTILDRATYTYDVHDIAAAVASGSHDNDGMIIAPTSMKTLAAIASGYTENLIHRAADCMLKEERKLILLFREMPLNLIHLRNLTTLKEAGATILPASPGFYYHPQSVADLVDFVVAKVLSSYGIRHSLTTAWNPEYAQKSVDSQNFSKP